MRAPIASGLEARGYVDAPGDFNHDTIATSCCRTRTAPLQSGNERDKRHQERNRGQPRTELESSRNRRLQRRQHSDILLQNANGAVAVWKMTGTSLSSSAVLANPGANWKAVGTGDFDDDGHADILLQNTNGSVAVWETDGTKVTTSAVVANPGESWKAIGTGDFNADGHSDILLQNADGRVAIGR